EKALYDLNRVKLDVFKNSKLFYDFTNSKWETSEFPTSFRLDDSESSNRSGFELEYVESSDSSVIFDLLANLFQQNYSNDTSTCLNCRYSTRRVIFTEDEVLHYMKTLKPPFATGPDTDSPHSLREFHGRVKLSALSHFFEYFVTRRMNGSVRCIISPTQNYCFKGHQSTCVSYATSSVIIVIYAGFSNSFDKINHKLSMQKLEF
uniref:Uncharacterized protein n=1 Tax=Glossina morsitans morsitans TaxID=37546 RepID=A0A1B0FJD1_GLOMM